MVKLYNATLHSQADLWGEFREAGFTLVKDGQPFGVVVPAGANSDWLQKAAWDVVAGAKDAGASAILVGGATGLAICIAVKASANGLTVHEVITERVRDESDRFEFRFSGVRRVL